MKLKKLVALSLVSAMAATSLAACSSGSSETTAATTQATAETTTAGGAETTAASGEKQKLTVSVWDNAASPQFSAIADAFMKKNPNVEVELIDTQSDEYNNKLTVLLSGGDSDPDVIFVKEADTQIAMKNKNQLLNLDEYIKKDSVDLSMYSGAAEQLQMDGSQYTVPFRKDWYVLYYNKDIFDKAGVAYPSDNLTWDEYEALAKQMTSGEGAEKIYGSHNHTWMALVANWAIQDGKHTLMDEDYTFLKPAYEQALRMQEEGTIQSYANLKTASIHYISAFEQGQIAMMPMGTWFIGTLIKDQAANNFAFNWGVTTVPHMNGTEAGATVGSVTPVGINAKTDVPDLSWEFVKFATGEEGAAILADLGIFPAAESADITAKLAAIDGFPEDGAAALKTTSFAFDRPIDAKMAAVKKVIEEEHDLIMIGEEDIDTGLANMNSRSAEAREE